MIRCFLLSALMLNVISLPLEACPFASGKSPIKKTTTTKMCPLVISKKEVYSRFDAYPYYALEGIKNMYLASEFSIQDRLAQIQKELSKSLSSSLRKGLLSLQACFLVLESPSPQFAKNQYAQFIQHLRKASMFLDHEKECYQKRVEELAFFHFQVDLNTSEGGYDYFFSILPKKYQEMRIENLNVKEMNEIIYQIYSKRSFPYLIKKVNREIGKAFFMSWDPVLHSARSKIAEYQIEKRVVSVLRMARPVCGRSGWPRVDPIFISYLKGLKREGKKHLYINNQNTMVEGSEKKTSELLWSLAESEPFKSTFYCINLSYDSDFYNQKNQGRELAIHFMEKFVNHVLANEEGFRFSQDLMHHHSFKEYLETLFKELHKTYFKEAPFLVQRERTQFIDLAYAHIARYWIEALEIDCVNWTCRHGIDRAMCSLTLFDAVMQSDSQKPFSMASSLYISYWPALIYYHRPPISSRSTRAFSALEKILEIDPVNNGIK